MFISLKIVFLKKFINSILDDCFFIDYFYLLAIDKIYLIKEWKKNF